MLLRLKNVIELTGKSRSAIYADKTFPGSIAIGPRSVAWDAAEIHDWIEERKARRNRT